MKGCFTNISQPKSSQDAEEIHTQICSEKADLYITAAEMQRKVSLMIQMFECLGTDTLGRGVPQRREPLRNMSDVFKCEGHKYLPKAGKGCDFKRSVLVKATPQNLSPFTSVLFHAQETAPNLICYIHVVRVAASDNYEKLGPVQLPSSVFSRQQRSATHCVVVTGRWVVEDIVEASGGFRPSSVVKWVYNTVFALLDAIPADHAWPYGVDLGYPSPSDYLLAKRCFDDSTFSTIQHVSLVCDPQRQLTSAFPIFPPLPLHGTSTLVVAFQGVNGSGKSTAAQLLVRLLEKNLNSHHDVQHRSISENLKRRFCQQENNLNSELLLAEDDLQATSEQRQQSRALKESLRPKLIEFFEIERSDFENSKREEEVRSKYHPLWFSRKLIFTN